jgi:hypothetical protein
MPPKIATPNLF